MGFGDQFLIEPALFPARCAGVPGGDLDLAIDVPGGPFLLMGLSPLQCEHLVDRYAERCLGPEAAAEAFAIQIFKVGSGEFHRIEREGWVNTFEFDYNQSTVRVAGNRLMGQLTWRPRLAATLWTPLEERAEFLEAFENFFRTVVAYRLLERGGAVIHSAGVVDRDRAFIFYGHSGAGKTTLARRCQQAGRKVLSDDINALYLEAGAPVAAKMPFAGEFGHSNERVGPFPLAGLHHIEQAPVDSWRPLSPAASVASLVSCAPFLNHDPYRLPTLIGNLEAIVKSTTAGRLSCSLDGDLWATLERCEA
jgi:hypothetical protein